MSTEMPADGFESMFPEMFEKDTHKFQLQTLRARHQRMIDLHLMGLKNTNIAIILNVTTVSVGQCLKSELGKASIELRRGAREERIIDHQEQIERITEESLQVVQDVITGEGEIGAAASPALRTKTALDMLKKQIPDLAVVKHVGDDASVIKQLNLDAIVRNSKEVSQLPETLDVKAEDV